MTAPRALAEADLSKVEAVFTDVDGTLTSKHKLKSSTIASLEALESSGIVPVLVTGRPAGWGEAWARTLPVAGVIVENGGLYFAPDPKRPGKLRKVYVQPERERLANRRRLKTLVAKALRGVPGARLSMDSLYTEVDLAIDYNEEARLGPAAADKLETFLRKHDVQAVRSSVHVNCWIGKFDKLSTVKRFLKNEWGKSLEANDPRYIYVGDSFNDAPLFGGFSLSIGVANVGDVLGQIDPPPAFITRSREGHGFQEIVDRLLSVRSTQGRAVR
jgi:HAD superfamily hydrolase (TIGR01484 family)